MGKRGGVKNKIKKRVAHLKWLLYSNTPPPAWAVAQKFQCELDFLTSRLQNTNPQVPTQSGIKTVTNQEVIAPPAPKTVPQREKKCPADCPGPMDSVYCNYTCSHCGPKNKLSTHA